MQIIKKTFDMNALRLQSLFVGISNMLSEFNNGHNVSQKQTVTTDNQSKLALTFEYCALRVGLVCVLFKFNLA